MLRTALGFVVVLSLCVSLHAKNEPVVLLDFETGEPADGWRLGNLGLAEITVPEGATPSGGRALKLIGKGHRANISRPVSVEDWRGFRALSFHAAVKAGGPVKMRIYAAASKGRAGMLRRFELEPGPWRKVVLPLAVWRENNAERIGDFGSVGRLVIQWDAGPGEVSLDDLRLLPGKRGNLSCRPTTKDWRALAFGKRGVVRESRHFVLLTDSKKMTSSTCKRFLRLLEKGHDDLTDRLGVPEPETDRTPVVYCADVESSNAFVKRLGEHYGVNINPDRSGCSAVLGVAVGVFDSEYGWARPLVFRRAMAASLQRRLRLAPFGNWIQPGLQWSTQIRLFPESGGGDSVPRHFRTLSAGNEGLFAPLGQLLRREKHGSKQNLQLATVFDWLGSKHRARLPAFWAEVAGSTQPVRTCGCPAMEKALGKEIGGLHVDYVAWGVRGGEVTVLRSSRLSWPPRSRFREEGELVDAASVEGSRDRRGRPSWSGSRSASPCSCSRRSTPTRRSFTPRRWIVSSRTPTSSSGARRTSPLERST